MVGKLLSPQVLKLHKTTGKHQNLFKPKFIQNLFKQINIFATSSQNVNYTRNPHPATNGILGHFV